MPNGPSTLGPGAALFGAANPFECKAGTATVTQAMHPGRSEQDGSTTDDDRRTALRFALGRPGWRVEAGATTQGGAYLSITTPCSKTGGQRSWRVARTRQGFLVHEEASARSPAAVATMRDALVAIWEAVTSAAPD